MAATDDDWTTSAVRKLDATVGIVRDKAVVPITTVARALVFGTLVVMMGLMIAVLLAIAMVRGLDVLVPGDVWSAHAIVGGLFVLVGLFLWSKRTPRTASQ